MTIFTLVLYVAIVALILTVVVGVVFKSHKSWLMTFLQNFCGSLFIFSGYVKAIDPLGTAFKMDEYFSEFYYTFNETALKFIAPMFPWMSEHSLAISVAMIVFEIALGVMLLLGSRPKLTAWLFLLLVVFFTILTGFTYLTGYVPQNVNFFEFGKWGPYVETNMKVTDCGCFGDFIKLKPKVTFMKDVFLLLPSLIFVFKHKSMHQLFSARVRTTIVGAVTLLFIIFCVRNYSWNEPFVDFRPFKAGTNIRAAKAHEEEVASNVRITHYRLTNKASGQVVTLPYEQYIKEYQDYPKEEWEFEQIKTEPESEPTKISDFDITGPDGSNMTEEILNYQDYAFMVTAYKLKKQDEKSTGTSVVTDTIFAVDTVALEGLDSVVTVKRVESMQQRTVETEVFTFEEGYKNRFTDIINPVMDAAQEAGYRVFAVTNPEDPAAVEDFRHATQSDYPFYTADDLLLKTIQRSNPGVVLWKDGKIIQKWHFKKLPSFEEIQEAYLK